ncbi:MAG: hypothetical protein KGJ80_09420 [Chloroflexota bacterium]|nr:hypothetical protein [Chloroflexota bacterium]
MPRLTEQEQQEIIRYLEADKPLPDKFRFLLFADKREVELVWNGKSNEVCNIVLPFQGRDHILENEWQTFRTKKDRSLELKSVFHECPPGRRKIAVKVVDILANDTMTIVEVKT